VVPGDEVRLSEHDAAQKLLRASEWASEITAASGFLPQLSAFAAALTLVTGVESANLIVAINEYISGISGLEQWLSSEVRVP
jgi:hypothetical protein